MRKILFSILLPIFGLQNNYLWALTSEQKKQKFYFDLALDTTFKCIRNGVFSVPGFVANRVISDGVTQTLQKIPVVGHYAQGIVKYTKQGYAYRKAFKENEGHTHGWIPAYGMYDIVPDIIKWRLINFACDKALKKLHIKNEFPEWLKRQTLLYFMALRGTNLMKEGIGYAYDTGIKMSKSVAKKLYRVVRSKKINQPNQNIQSV